MLVVEKLGRICEKAGRSDVMRMDVHTVDSSVEDDER